MVTYSDSAWAILQRKSAEISNVQSWLRQKERQVYKVLTQEGLIKIHVTISQFLFVKKKYDTVKTIIWKMQNFKWLKICLQDIVVFS